MKKVIGHDHTIDPIPTIIQELFYKFYNMFSIDIGLIDIILRAPTQVIFNGICDYYETCVKVVIYLIFLNK